MTLSKWGDGGGFVRAAVDDVCVPLALERRLRRNVVVKVGACVIQESELALEAESDADRAWLGGCEGADTWVRLRILRPDGSVAVVLACTWNTTEGV